MTKIGMHDLSPAVLNYPFAETSTLLARLTFPGSVLLGIPATDGSDLLDEAGFTPNEKIDLPESRGKIDLEEFHVPILDRIEQHYEVRLPGLSGFEHRYPMPGSETCIQLLIAEWASSGQMTELAVLGGDYFGYGQSADIAGLKIHNVNSLEEAGPPIEGRVWFLSNPSALDGNWHKSEVLVDFINAGHEVVIDYAYGGLVTDFSPIDVSAPNIKAIITSPSKIYGVFWHRLTGTTYTRQPARSLEETIWFKNIPGMASTLALFETFGLDQIARLYKPTQIKACQAITNITGEPVNPSDTILMAHTDSPLSPRFADYKFLTLPLGRSRFRLPTVFEKILSIEET